MEISDSIALGSLVVALSALGAALWQGYISRRHNELSVEPRLTVCRSQHDELEYVLENHGLGPAIIVEFAICIGGQVILNPPEDPYPSAFSVLGVKNADYEFHLPMPEDAYRAGAREVLLKLMRKENNEEDLFDKCSAGMVFKITYQSIYKSKQFQYHGSG